MGIMKLVRYIKIFNNKNYINTTSASILQTGVMAERVVILSLVSILGFHLCNCAWLWTGLAFTEDYEQNWLTNGYLPLGIENESRNLMYRAAMYHTITMSCGASLAINVAE